MQCHFRSQGSVSLPESLFSHTWLSTERFKGGQAGLALAMLPPSLVPKEMHLIKSNKQHILANTFRALIATLQSPPHSLR